MAAFRGTVGRGRSEEWPRRRAAASGGRECSGKRPDRSRYSLRRCWEREWAAAVEEGAATGGRAEPERLTEDDSQYE